MRANLVWPSNRQIIYKLNSLFQHHIPPLRLSLLFWRRGVCPSKQLNSF